MRRFSLTAAASLAAVVALSGGLTAQSGPSLVQADELGMRVADGDSPVILWIGGDETWDAGRIPGARRIGLGDISVSRGEYAEPGSIVLDLPFELDRVRQAFERRGVSSDRDVVVVFDSPSRFTQATRVVWTLTMLGMGDRTRLLDGGQPAWVEAGGELTTDPESGGEPSEGAITTAPAPDRVVDLGWLAREYRSDELSLVDARSSASYTGEREEFPGRAGHIPGAGSLPIEVLLDDGGRVLPMDELASLLRDAGANEGARVVTYCHIGQRASAAWFAATLAGFDAAIYDGSMNEWGRTELPLTSGANR
ncbi:MAG TPA: rhodanese-like domain-containing protein [Longimicrobiales bacterium]|nr:rhodanese-like domain-containing protein [Longimicrobiales bacterium]